MTLTVLTAYMPGIGFELSTFLIVFGAAYLILAFVLASKFGMMSAVPLAVLAVALGSGLLFVFSPRMLFWSGRSVIWNWPMFLLIAGILYVGLAFALKPAGALSAVPVAAIMIVFSLAWMFTSGSGLMFSGSLWTWLGIGIVFLFVGKAFAAS